jgi:diguanylate cyclase (GGDEF)-like protein
MNVADFNSYTDLGRIGERLEYPAGATLWTEGEVADHVLLLLRGQLEVTHIEPDGEVVVIRLLQEGSIVGEIASLDGGTRSAGIRTKTPCSVIRISASEFRELLREHPPLFEKLFWEQVDRVRALTREVTNSHHQAITDGLTRLYNIGFFRKRLEGELERAGVIGDVVSVAMFDVDNFKHLNDTQGHQAGDHVLTEIAAILREAGRRGDIVARYGGEEFIFLLYGASTEEAVAFADAIRRRIEDHPFPNREKQPLGRVTVSCGVATFPRDGNTPRVVIETADGNLYVAKRSGRNRVVPAPGDV